MGAPDGFIDVVAALNPIADEPEPPAHWSVIFAVDDATSELPVAAYEVFTSTDLLGAMALQRMMAKLSTRRYRAGLEPVGAAVEASATFTSKSGGEPALRGRHQDGAGADAGRRPVRA